MSEIDRFQNWKRNKLTNNKTKTNTQLSEIQCKTYVGIRSETSLVQHCMLNWSPLYGLTCISADISVHKTAVYKQIDLDALKCIVNMCTLHAKTLSCLDA